MTAPETNWSFPPGSLTAELLAAREAERRSFHMPGHKGGRGASKLAHEVLGSAAFAADLSELSGFDYLHSASGGIAASQRSAAALFGAEHTHYLINGSTVGNIAALLATTSDDGEALVLRASHRSMYAGLAMSGATPRYVPPCSSAALDGWFGGDMSVAAAIAAEPGHRIQAVHITRPNYYGFCVDVAAWVDLAHSLDVPLIVDEAHGTHFVFSDDLPASALSMGADIAIQSPHKTLSSLTQSSLLHVQGNRADHARLSTVLAMLQSSSPSALLLASLDLACTQMKFEGPQLWSAIVALAYDVRAQINAMNGLNCVGDEILGVGGISSIDPTKIVVDVTGVNLSGWTAAAALRANSGINPEFADARRIVCSLSVADDVDSAAVLIDALSQLARAAKERVLPSAEGSYAFSYGTADTAVMALTPRRAGQQSATCIQVAQAAGRISAEFVIPYPPGIPLVVPGEVLDHATLLLARQLKNSGASIVGTADATLSTIRVLVGTDFEGRGYPQ